MRVVHLTLHGPVSDQRTMIPLCKAAGRFDTSSKGEMPA
jgi:hypothetical protein